MAPASPPRCSAAPVATASRGCARFARPGGATVVQDPADAPFRHLPEAAVAEGLADEVLGTAGLLRWAERVLAGEVPGGVPPSEPAPREGPPRATGRSRTMRRTEDPEAPGNAAQRAHAPDRHGRPER